MQKMVIRFEAFVAGFEAAARPAARASVYADQEALFELWRLVDYHFNQEELKTLAFAVGVEYESLSAEGKSGKARELIAHLSRRGQLEMLLDWCMEMRPNVAWRR